MSQELKPCPFCECTMRISSNRDWHHLTGEHDDDCAFEADDDTMCVPATDEMRGWLVNAWNRRATVPAAQQEYDFAKLMMYPEEWDTAAYPTLESAMWEAISCAQIASAVDHERDVEATPAAQQAGWVSVPVEPTPEMLDVYKRWHRAGKSYMDISIYRAMIAAAPSAPPEAAPIQLSEGSSMPVDMAQAKRWIVQLRGRVDTLLGIINAPAEAASARDVDKLRRLRDGMDKWGWCAEFGALAMEVLREPSAPTAQQNSKSGLAAQVAAAQAEHATWSTSQRAGVQLEGGDQAEEEGD